jgi:hypothetical protein
VLPIFIPLKNPSSSTEIESADLASNGKHATIRPSRATMLQRFKSDSYPRCARSFVYMVLGLLLSGCYAAGIIALCFSPLFRVTF